MQSLALSEALTDFIEAAGAHLRGEVESGAEIPFELAASGGRRGAAGPSLYAYRPLTGAFVAERMGALERLPGHERAARALSDFDGLDRYLAAGGHDPAAMRPGARVRAAIEQLLGEVFAEQSDFLVHPQRVRRAVERLERAALASAGGVTIAASLHGMTLSSSELALTRGLSIARPEALQGLPEGLAAAGGEAAEHLVVTFACEQEDLREALAHGRAVLHEMLRGLRLFGDGRVTLGALAWARVGGAAWAPVALGTGGRPRGMLVVSAEQEDELRAFCNLISRRAPHRNEVAWALRRFELGCDRGSEYEALSDHLLALRALLEPEGAASGLLGPRLAALCALPPQRVRLRERTAAALELERSFMQGTAVEHAGGLELAREMADHLRALLRDVICGHLETELAALADDILLEDEPPLQADELALGAPVAHEELLPGAEEPGPEYLEAQALAEADPITADAGLQQDAPEAEEAPRQAPAPARRAAPLRARRKPAQASGEEVPGDLGESEEVLDFSM